MSSATVSLNLKLANGTLIQLGGVGFDDFYQNLLSLYGGDTAAVESIIAPIRAAATPVSAGSSPAPAAPAQPNYEQQAVQTLQQYGAQPLAQPARQNSQPPPGQGANQAPLCPNHQQPAKWVPPGVAKATGKPYEGFWTCAVAQRGDRSCHVGR